MFPIEPSTNVTVQLSQSTSATLIDASDIRTDLALIKQIETGRWKIDSATKQMIFYAIDGVTPIATFDLKNSVGSPATQDVYERIPV